MSLSFVAVSEDPSAITCELYEEFRDCILDNCDAEDLVGTDMAPEYLEMATGMFCGADSGSACGMRCYMDIGALGTDPGCEDYTTLADCLTGCGEGAFDEMGTDEDHEGAEPTTEERLAEVVMVKEYQCLMEVCLEQYD